MTAQSAIGQAKRGILALILVTALAVASGCGSTKKHAAPAATSQTTTNPATATSGSGPGALQGEAQSAATGDIPDNQVYVTFSNARAGYAIKYPEGWAQSGNGPRVVFRDKNNLVRIVVASGPHATLATARADMQALLRAVPSLKFQSPVATRISSAPAIKVTYTTESAMSATPETKFCGPRIGPRFGAVRMDPSGWRWPGTGAKPTVPPFLTMSGSSSIR